MTGEQCRRREEALLNRLIDGRHSVKSARLFHIRSCERNDLTPPSVVTACRDHVEALCRAHRIAYKPVAQFVGAGYSWSRTRVIEGPPIRSLWGYALLLHEIGHIVRPCARSHRVTMTPYGTCCVRCELVAWAWARFNARGPWDSEMQAALVYGLTSYSRHATPAERWEIQCVIGSPLARRREQLDRVMKGTL